MPSAATTGTSTSMPKAMMSDAMEICCSGMFSSLHARSSVIATVSGIAVASTSAERQSIRNKPTMITISTASMKHLTKW